MNEFMQRPGRPVNQRPANPNAEGSPANEKSRFSPTKNLSSKAMLLPFFVMVASAVLALLLIGLLILSNKPVADKINDRVLSATTQAVFLDDPNGQVYFGDLRAIDSETLMLTDIYYIRVTNNFPQNSGENVAPEISLNKLGNELHGPIDTMYINRDRVLYWENLTTDSQVVCAIRANKISLGEQNVERSDNCPPIEQNQNAGATNNQITNPNQNATDQATPQNNDQNQTNTEGSQDQNTAGN